MRLDLASKLDLGNAAQILAQDFRFDFQLMIVSGVLVVASAAAREVRARRRNALARRLDDGGSTGARKA